MSKKQDQHGLKLVCVIETNDMSYAESILHQKFSASRGNGEWFRLGEEDMQWIKSRRRLDR